MKRPNKRLYGNKAKALRGKAARGLPWWFWLAALVTAALPIVFLNRPWDRNDRNTSVTREAVQKVAETPPVQAAKGSGLSPAPPASRVGGAEPDLPPNRGAIMTLSNAVLETRGTNVDALINLGVALLEKRQFSEALELFGKASKLNPEDETIPYNMALALARMGRTQEAIERYREAIRMFPEYPDAHNNLGNILMSQGGFPEAVMHFNKALEASPDTASVHNNLGTALARMQKTKEAIPHFQEAVRLDSNYVEAHFNLANSYLADGQVDSAIEKFQEIVRRYPSFSPARPALDRALKKKQDSRSGN